MAENYFAQFHDAPEQASPSGTANYFSQFHPADGPADAPAPFAERFNAAPKTAQEPQPSLLDAVTDIPKEVKGAATTALQHATGNSVDDLPGYDVRTRGELGPIEGLARTGKQVLGIPELLSALPVSMARSVIGHLMAHGEHWVGALLNPERAAHDDPQKMYEAAKGDVDTALAAARPAGVPVRAMVPALPAEAATAALPAKAAEPAAVARVWQEPAGAAPKIAAPSVAELKAAATDVWESPAIKAIDIPATDIASLRMNLERDLVNRGFRPSPGSAPETFGEIRNLTPPAGVQAVKVDDLRSARRALNIQAAKRDPMTNTPTSEANAATQAIGHIDAFLDGIAPELKVANENYSAAKSAERLDYRSAKAERRAAKSGTGGNLENAMRQEADKIPDRGLTVDEKSARDRIVEGSPARNALRTAGKLGVDGGLSLMMHAGAALGTGGTTLPVTVAGTVARKLGEMLTKAEMSRLNEAVRSRSPLASSMQKLNQAAGNFAKSRNAKTYALAVIAARNLASNLNGVGINVSPTALISQDAE